MEDAVYLPERRLKDANDDGQDYQERCEAISLLTSLGCLINGPTPGKDVPEHLKGVLDVYQDAYHNVMLFVIGGSSTDADP